MAGFFGTSGTTSIVAGLYILGLPVTRIIGTSVLVALFNALSGFAGHMMVDRLDLAPLILLGSGSTIGGFIGQRILSRLNVAEKIYGVLFILLVVVFGLVMLFT